MRIPDPVSAAPPACILFALPDEAKNFQARARTRHGRALPAAVAISGAGARNAEKAAKALCLPISRCLLICGFAGGLAAELTPGVLILSEGVTNSTGDYLKADSQLLAVAESVRVPDLYDTHLYAMRGAIYTGDKVFGRGVEKQELAGRSEAVAVDMETFAAAQVAEEYNIPWLAVRVITDGVNDDMPLDFNALADANGNVDKKRVIAAMLTHPWKIPGLIRLGARSQQAAKNLAVFLEAFLKALPDTPE